ncbi:MAG: hypothetical protein HUU37_08930, partial [Bdellovibrionales bacterium]|nr:hypothetical protein [Bdellovibrionales bacterium]
MGRQKRRRNQRGQALLEFLLIMMLAVGFTRYVYYNRDFGFKAMIDKTMLRLGAFLEQNLKSGARIGPNGR